MDDPSVVLVEVDEDTTAYDKGHIPGAVKLDWKTDLQDPVRRDFVDKQRFEARLSERGVTPDDTVVLYGGNNNWFAAYAYWYFKVYGHQDVRLLDGGRKKWELRLAGADRRGAAATDDALHRARSRTTRSGRSATRSASIGIGNQNLVDVRSPDEFPVGCWPRRICRRSRRSAAATSPAPRNVPWSKAANDDGTFKSDDELRDALRRRRRRPRAGHHRLLPDRRALRAHLVRAPRAARTSRT